VPGPAKLLRGDPRAADPHERPARPAAAGHHDHRHGELLRNDLVQASTKWIVVEYSGVVGFVNTLWLGGVDAWQRVWACPAGWTP
jgi:hypothetical protein